MPPEDRGSITRWIDGLKAGDREAVGPLWDRYSARLVRLARDQLRAARRAGAAEDEEDAALSAFESFCVGVECGRFPQLSNRDDLWRLLTTITVRKAWAQLRRDRRQKRGDGRLLDEAGFARTGPEGDPIGLEQVIGPDPPPELAALVAEQFARLLDMLGDDVLRRIAIWRMEGYTRDEIAERLGCARRTVARRLELIRTIWLEEGA